VVNHPERDKPFDKSKLRTIRAAIVKGLVQLAGAEPVRVPRGRYRLPEPSDKERRDSVEKALRLLGSALSELSDAIKRSPGDVESVISEFRAGVSDGDDLPGTIDRAKDTVARLLLKVPKGDVTAGDRAEGNGTAVDPEQLTSFLEKVRLQEFVEEVRVPISKLVNDWFPVRKIFVAVHGIGDQFHNETVQSVAIRVCDYVGVPAALPLGRFHGGGATVTGAFLPVPDRDPPVDCGFAEIYWADVPRGPALEQHTLEEPTKWARALVERLWLRARPADEVTKSLPEWTWERIWALLSRLKLGETAPMTKSEKARQDSERLEQLLEELIQGVVVADRLVLLADKAGLFKFDLKKLLNDYLNDVQVVTEFEDYRDDLLRIFDEVLEKIHRYLDRSEIYIIAHSEGTVVAFMGLLKGLHEKAPWTEMIRGLMTIGSPLNKHVRFWPELFEQFHPPANGPERPILWKNYYDYGDPIGYDLKPTRQWMAKKRWQRFFVFQNPRDQDPNDPDSGDDIGFTRYLFPGEAHNEYWRDPGVFGHFIEKVVEKPEGQRKPLLKPAGGKTYGVPGTIGIARLTSWGLPYVLAAALLFLACYLLYSAVRACLDPVGARYETAWDVSVNVCGLSLLIAGASLLARIPRLTKQWGWCWLMLLSLGYLLIYPDQRRAIEEFLVAGSGIGSLVYDLLLLAVIVGGGFLGRKAPSLGPVLCTLIPVVGLVLILRLIAAFFGWLLPAAGLVPWRSMGVILVAWAIGFMAACTSWRYPRSGTKPLVHTGGLIILLIVATALATAFVFGPAVVGAQDRATIAKAVHARQQQTLQELAGKLRDPRIELPLTDEEIRRLNAAASLQLVTDAALEQGPIWPVFLAGAGFLYIWWLAIVTFDLTFVWHLYIRFSGAQEYLKALDPASQ
jgi:hypothetical protein